jgi:hypothetical protein
MITLALSGHCTWTASDAIENVTLYDSSIIGEEEHRERSTLAFAAKCMPRPALKGDAIATCRRYKLPVLPSYGGRKQGPLNHTPSASVRFGNHTSALSQVMNL